MTNINTGGTAFPCEGGHDSGLHADAGMTLRDYFAAKAISGLLSSGAMSMFSQKDIARHSYVIADEMIRARGEQ